MRWKKNQLQKIKNWIKGLDSLPWNEEVDVFFNSMEEYAMNIAFDVDGTLIDVQGNPRREVIMLLVALSQHNNIILWSGGGVEYAKQRARELEIVEYIDEYLPKSKNSNVDLAIDDQEVNLGTRNLRV